MRQKEVHNTISILLCFAVLGALMSTINNRWWSCGNSPIDILKMCSYAIGLGICGILFTYAAHVKGTKPQLRYWLELLLRLLLVYAVFTTALLKAEGHFYSYSLLNGETKLADLEANTFANAFYGFSPTYQAYVGYAIIAGLVFICFNRTQRIGNILMAVILTNAIFLNYSFGSCYIFKNSVYLSVIAYFILTDFPAYFAFFTKRPLKGNQNYHPLKGESHLNQSSTIFKIILLIGFYFYNHYYIEDVKNNRTMNVNSPITGVWKITDIKFLKKDLPEENKKDIQSFKSIILDKGRYGAVEIADSLSFFEYLIDPKYNQLELWNFQDFWELDIKGKYKQISEDSLIYIGRNRKDSLQISLKLESKK